MRDANFCPPVSGLGSDAVLYGVARGLENLFPPVEHPRFFEHDTDGGSSTHEMSDEEAQDQR
ncbi:hypothetical protein [Methylobacterium planeticum]|uniref:Uncharacterized protein n=1 Tax=Methylobacterium planeticum TaxID=2615211 RepID=A0A6N6MS68_9HYPH|nr:hypothetical protein [Methylobacterium planeticum]KAB1072195.1 hypothetical protein F6X51_17390 [Methylobacterium planeticum]